MIDACGFLGTLWLGLQRRKARILMVWYEPPMPCPPERGRSFERIGECFYEALAQ